MATSFWWTHVGHLLTKPLVALVLYAGLHWWPLHLGAVLAAVLAVGVPEVWSGVRKHIKWPGSMTSAIGWKDLAADGWAASILIAPLAMEGLPLLFRVVLGLAMLAMFVGSGLHRWGLP